MKPDFHVYSTFICKQMGIITDYTTKTCSSANRICIENVKRVGRNQPTNYVDQIEWPAVTTSAHRLADDQGFIV